jgi:two-component system cell cycle response regulator
MEEDKNQAVVLIVEDEAINRKLIEKMVSSLGYRTLVAQNGVEGLDITKTQLPQIVLTDALMPKLDGREMCRLLKSDPLTRHVKVVVMTALYVKSKYRYEAINQFQADEYLNKPLKIDELKIVLEKCVA